MPVRINLLPKYVFLKKIFQRALMGCIIGVVVWAVVLMLVYANKQASLHTLEASLANVEPAAQATEAAKSAKQSADSKKSALEANVKFMMAASQTGAKRAELLDLFRPYIYRGSVVSEIDLSDGKNAMIQGMVKSPDDYARFITALRQGTAPTGPLFASLPVGNGIPGFPDFKTKNVKQGNDKAGGAQLAMVVFPLQVQAKGQLLNPIKVPVAPGGKPASQKGQGGPGGPMP